MWCINDIFYKVDKNDINIVVIDAASRLGFDIPRFCYHEGLKVAGNRRMCLVEDIKSAKPVVSCAMAVTVDLSIFLNTVRVKKARESVMEFLPINHPLDCPIRDQGGECDSQDLSMIYGSDHGRFYEYKRNIEDKNIGSIVKMVMNRRILRTRCVRFAVDIAGFNSFGITGRGIKSEISSYITKILETELSGNLADICPVGALTSKPYSFSARPWELKKNFTINIFDDEIQFIRADVKENVLLRILPAKNNNYNFLTSAWITNRVRFSYESLLNTKKLTVVPSIYNQEIQWSSFFKIFALIIKNLLSKKVLGISNLLALTDLTMSIQDILLIKTLSCSVAANYLQSTPVLITLSLNYVELLKQSKSFFIINLDLEYQAPILHLLLLQTNVNFFILSWYSKLLCVQNNLIVISSSIKNFINTLKFKTWPSVLVSKFVILISSFFLINLHSYTNTNIVVINNSLSERVKLSFAFLSSIHAQNSFLLSSSIFFNFSKTKSEKFLIKKDPIELLFVNNLESSSSLNTFGLLPTSTHYEQAGLSYYTTSYKIFNTTRVISTSLKSTISVLKALLLVTLGTVTNLLPTTFPDFSAINRFQLSFRRATSYFCAILFTRINKILYNDLHNLTRNAPALRFSELKNIYR